MDIADDGRQATAAPSLLADLGLRLRERRTETGIGLRELARRIGVSASLISQIETGKVQPSVNTLYALASELGGSLDEIVFGGAPRVPVDDVDDGPLPGLAALSMAHPPIAGVQRQAERKRIQLNRGVRWERLTPTSAPGVEFLYVVYDPGAESSPPDAFQRHSGREWAYIISGTLHVAVGWDEYTLHAGDAVTYGSSTPHRLWNCGDEPVEAVWFQIG